MRAFAFPMLFAHELLFAIAISLGLQPGVLRSRSS